MRREVELALPIVVEPRVVVGDDEKDIGPLPKSSHPIGYAGGFSLDIGEVSFKNQ